MNFTAADGLEGHCSSPSRRRPSPRASTASGDRQHHAGDRDAIAGDYSMTFRAASPRRPTTTRPTSAYTVEASPIGAILGAALIVAALGRLYWVFRRYGRRWP